MRRIIIILVIAIIHLSLALAASLGTFEVSGVFFGLYPPPSEGTLHTALEATRAVLMFPLGLVAESLNPDIGFLAWPLMLLNSLLWATMIYFLVNRLVAAKKRKSIRKEEA